MVCTFRDNTDSVLLVEKLQELATIDPLTRLYNRRYFLDQAERQLVRLARGEKPVSVLMLDLDHFKTVNDTMGHAAGDEVLKGAAAIIASCVRGVDVVARFGGEEFICLLPETGEDGALLVANRICEGIRNFVFRSHEGAEISITISIGVRSVPYVHSGDNLDLLIADADVALYRAKVEGRNRVVAF
jgi:diguanylate cyclase (GGDEF)-like protein